MPKSTYAICGAILFAAFGICVSFNGTGYAAWALLIGGVSQFVAQDDGKHSWKVSNGLAYVAILFAFAAAWGLR